MRLLIAIIGFFTRQTVYQKFIRAVMCIGKLTKLSNILCKIIRWVTAEKKKKNFFFFFFFLNVLLRIAFKDKECK